MDFNDGGAAGLLGDDAAGTGGGADGGGDAAAAAAGGGDGGQGGGAGGQGGGADGGGQSGAAVPEWMSGLSADPVGDQPSHIDYLKSKGVDDLNKLVTSYREAEKAISGKGVVSVPKEGASAEEIAAYHRQIGVPEAVDKYELPTVPPGAELDMAAIEPLREVAFKAGVPAAGFKALAEAVVERQIADQDAERTRQDGLREDKFREWGNDKTRNVAIFQRGLRAFGIDAAKAAAIQRGMGSDGLLDFGLKLGQLTGEDGLLGGGGQQQFGMTGEQAQAKIDESIKDPAKGQAIKVKGSAEEAEWNRLNTIVAHYKDLKTREEQG